MACIGVREESATGLLAVALRLKATMKGTFGFQSGTTGCTVANGERVKFVSILQVKNGACIRKRIKFDFVPGSASAKNVSTVSMRGRCTEHDAVSLINTA